MKNKDKFQSLTESARALLEARGKRIKFNRGFFGSQDRQEILDRQNAYDDDEHEDDLNYDPALEAEDRAMAAAKRRRTRRFRRRF